MKKHLLHLLALLLFSQAQGQITLTESSYPAFLQGTDSLIKTTYNSPLPSLTAAPGGVWDLSTVTDSTPVFFNYRVAGLGHQFADSNDYMFATYAYHGNTQSDVTALALAQYGIHINSEAYAIGTSITDSILIPAQNNAYSNPRSIIKFPASFNSSWHSSYQSDFNYNLSYSTTIFHEPGIVRSYYIETDTVVGWGKLRVKNGTGSPSEYMDVLQVQTTITTIDSFYFNGTTTDVLLPSILATLGFNQGQQKTSYTMNFYREGEVTPLAEVVFKNAAFTLPAGCTYHRQRLTRPASASALKTAPTIVAYPNPVSRHCMFAILPAGIEKWNYELKDIQGKCLAAHELNTYENKTEILFDEAIMPGAYTLHFYCNGQHVSAQQISIAP